MSKPIIELVMCPFWGEHTQLTPCQKIKCDDCSASIAISKRTLPIARQRKMKLVCYPCGSVAKVKAEIEGGDHVFMGSIRDGKLPGNQA